MTLQASTAMQHTYHKLRVLTTDFVNLFYPRLCCSCDANLLQGEDEICIPCLFKLPKTYYWNYDVSPMEQTLQGRLKMDGACAFLHFKKGGSVQQMLHRFKYEGQREIGIKLGTLFAHQLIETQRYTDTDLIIPVPLHHTRKRRRGYNQSMVIASAMAEVLGAAASDDFVVRNMATDTQTKRNRFDRSTNVEEVFTCVRPDKVAGKCVMLVDDVVTTGSTIEAVGQTLLRAGVAKLYVVALAVPSQ